MGMEEGWTHRKQTQTSSWSQLSVEILRDSLMLGKHFVFLALYYLACVLGRGVSRRWEMMGEAVSCCCELRTLGQPTTEKEKVMQQGWACLGWGRLGRRKWPSARRVAELWAGELGAAVERLVGTEISLEWSSEESGGLALKVGESPFARMGPCS